MKPRTKFQRRIVELSHNLPAISTDAIRWANDKCFEHIARKTKKGNICCLECGVEWMDGNLKSKTVVCPFCDAKLKVQETRKKNFNQSAYLCILDVCEEFQVIRFVEVCAYYRLGKAANYQHTEVVQRYMSGDGKFISLAKLRNMNLYSDAWIWSSDLEIRAEKWVYNINPNAVYPKMKILPEIKKRGFKKSLHNIPPCDLFQVILTNNTAETLLKTKQEKLLEYFISVSLGRARYYWNSIRIVIRNKYKIADAGIWCDYIDLLNYFQKDIHSPKYVCPQNLKREHDRLSKKKEEILKKQRMERELQKALTEEQKFLEMKSKFFGLAFTDGKIEVKVIDSIKEFMEEGKAMHHCVFACQYYLKKDSLILSARIKNERVETVEVSLETMKVIQSRAVCNKNSKYHDQIIELVNNNIQLIQERITA